MNYQQTLDYIYRSLPMFHRIGAAAYKNDLDNTLALSRLTEHPENSFPSIHIAGTNGKGSVSHLLASILQESGYRTALFTSPHLKDFRERMRVNGKMIPKSAVTEFFKLYRSSFEPLQPSFFEITFALAMWWFSAEKPEIAVIETGMGGRLDSTNIISPLVSVITNIGYDHRQFLGDTLEKIAIEKAGIIKPGIPVVIGESKSPSEEVFRNKAKELGSPIYFADREYDVNSFRFAMRPSPHLEMEVWRSSTVYLKKLSTPLAGLYQLKNCLSVLKATDILQQNGFAITEETILQGFNKVRQNTGIQGRWQFISREPLVLCDTGHNIDGIREVVRQLRFIPHEQLHMVFGMVEDKERDDILDILPRAARYYFCKPGVPRGLDAKLLAEDALKYGIEGSVWPSVTQALEEAKRSAGPKDLIFVGGSTFVVAEVV
jgi:dihydrofolate synthase/folylpolyglutamate synthase